MAEILPAGRWRVAAAVLGAVALALVVFVLAFDWNWLRGPLERHLAERSGREVRIGALDVELDSSFQPTVRLRDVYVQNADWAASKEPLITAREVAAEFALSGLWGDNIEVSRLTLVDAKIDMERLADGRRNWRLWKPQNIGPGRVRVMLLEARESQLRFVNREIDLDFTATATPLASDDADAKAHELVTRIAYRGKYEGHAFSGESATPRAFSFRGSGLSFPARGHLTSRGTHVEFDGVFTDLFDLGPADAKLKLSGPSLERIYPFIRIQPPPSKPYSVEAQLTLAGEVYRLADINGKIGSSALGGDAVYDRSGERPRLEAALRLASAISSDIAPLLGVRRTGEKEKPARAFNLEALRAVDARIDARAVRLSVEELPAAEDVRVQAHLANGLLELKGIEFRVAGGRIAGTASFDARGNVAAAALKAEMLDADLQKLVPAAAKRGLAGELEAKLSLSSRGASAADMMGNLSGTLEVRIDSGTISDLADAKLAMAFGRVVATRLRGERAIAIGCALAAFDVRGGVARSRRITFDTERTRVDGNATVDLRNDTLDAVLTPEEKKPGMFTRRASLRVRGELGSPEISMTDRVEQPRAPCTS